MCHTQIMKNLNLFTTQELVIIRNTLKTDGAKLLLKYLEAFMSKSTFDNSLNAEAFRGMGMILHEFKTFEKDVETVIQNKGGS